MIMVNMDQLPTPTAIQGIIHMAAVRKIIMGTLAITVRYSLDTYSNTVNIIIQECTVSHF